MLQPTSAAAVAAAAPPLPPPSHGHYAAAAVPPSSLSPYYAGLHGGFTPHPPSLWQHYGPPHPLQHAAAHPAYAQHMQQLQPAASQPQQPQSSGASPAPLSRQLAQQPSQHFFQSMQPMQQQQAPFLSPYQQQQQQQHVNAHHTSNQAVFMPAPASSAVAFSQQQQRAAHTAAQQQQQVMSSSSAVFSYPASYPPRASSAQPTQQQRSSSVSSAAQLTPSSALPDAAMQRGSSAKTVKKRDKRPRSEPAAFSASAASAEATEEAGDREGGDGSTDDDEEDAAAAPHFLSVLNSSRSSDGGEGGGGGGSAGGLGQYELELLQREVDELHDEAMAERNRADDMEDRYQKMLTKLRAMQPKLQQLDDTRRRAAAAAAEAAAPPDSTSSGSKRSGDDVLTEVRVMVDDLIFQSGIREEETAGAKDASAIYSASSVAHARLNRFLSKSQGERFCKPCRLVTTLSKKPFRTLLVDVQRQYTMSKRETRRMSKEEKEKLVGVPLRIMGTPHRNNIYFVAKSDLRRLEMAFERAIQRERLRRQLTDPLSRDVCILIHTRKGNVAKSIGQFSETQKARMPVLCVRSNGTVSTHILTVLTVDGVNRLLSASRSLLAPQVLTWILQQVEQICGDNPPDPPGMRSALALPSSPLSSMRRSASAPKVESAADAGGDGDAQLRYRQRQRSQQETAAAAEALVQAEQKRDELHSANVSMRTDGRSASPAALPAQSQPDASPQQTSASSLSLPEAVALPADHDTTMAVSVNNGASAASEDSPPVTLLPSSSFASTLSSSSVASSPPSSPPSSPSSPSSPSLPPPLTAARADAAASSGLSAASVSLTSAVKSEPVLTSAKA